MSREDKADEFETEQDRCEWLRERGVIIETAEDRRKQKQTLSETGTTTNKVLFVRIPWDSSQPLQQCEAYVKSDTTTKELLEDPLSNSLAQKAFSSSSSSTEVDLQLLLSQQTNTTLLSSDGAALPKISDDALRSVAERGSCEIFRLVPAVPSNEYNAIHVYLDEVGMLKRLPLNKRASDFAFRAGFNPPPKFYGDVYLGRVKYDNRMNRRHNVPFLLGSDTDPSAAWIQKAVIENLKHQQQANISSDIIQQQHSVGEDGIPKEEGLYSWTQTLEEIEIVVPLPDKVDRKQISVLFHSKRIKVLLSKEILVEIEFYASIDTDGCTWTLERKSLILTCEKQDGGVSWPRITV